MNFDNIEYLHEGTNRQREAYTVLTQNKVLQKLKVYSPILVGTIPINIDIDGSDLDIICSFTRIEEFAESVKENFGSENNFTIRRQEIAGQLTVIANFYIGDFLFEIFGQNMATHDQLGYRHMVVEHALLEKYGEEFRQQIISLKKQGHKTEPAFAVALGLTGDPYLELLKFESGN